MVSKRPRITMPTFKSSGDEFEDWVASLPPEFLSCRDFGHVWRSMTAHWDAEHHSFVRNMRCQRCKTNRLQRLGSDGTIGDSQYTYDEGYTAPRGSGYMSKDARAIMRLASTVRLIDPKL